MPARIVFMGSPEFALPVLRTLALHYPVVGVVTQPDRPAGRGKSLAPPPVKRLALDLRLPVIQPERLRDPAVLQQLSQWAPELIVVAAFGQILRSAVLELPPHGCINVHASLLPRWRGAAPVQAAILAGDHQTGVTIMRMDPGVDTGPLLTQRSLSISSEDTAASLSERLSTLGAALLLETLPAYLKGDLLPKPQVDADATYAPLLKKEDGLLHPHRSATELVRRVRAFNPWPGAYLLWRSQPLKVHRARAVQAAAPAPGTHLVWDRLPGIATSDGILLLEEIQPAGKKSMLGVDFLRGSRDWLA